MSEQERRRSAEDRRAAMRHEAEDAQAHEGGSTKSRFLVGDAELEKLGIKRYKLDSGKDAEAKWHKWSILEPHPDDTLMIAMPLFIHYGVGVNGEAFMCPRHTAAAWPRHRLRVPDKIKDGRCPVCEEADRLLVGYKRDKDGVGEEDRKKMYQPIRNLQAYSGSFTDPKPKRHVAWVVDETNLDAGVYLTEMPRKVYLGLIDQAVDPAGGAEIYVMEPGESGYTFAFKREGKGAGSDGKKGVEYSAFKLQPRGGALDDAWLAAVPRWEKVLVFHSYDEIRAAMVGGEAPAEPTKAATSARTAVEDGEQVKDELAEVFGEPAAAPPVRRRRTTDPEGDGSATSSNPEPERSGVSPEAQALADRIRNRRRTRGA